MSFVILSEFFLQIFKQFDNRTIFGKAVQNFWAALLFYLPLQVHIKNIQFFYF